MYDFSVSSVFALGSVMTAPPFKKSQPKKPDTDLDKIDHIVYILRHRERAEELQQLIQGVATKVHDIIIRDLHNYHLAVMEYLGKGDHLMTYSYYRGMLSLNVRLTKSDAKLRIEHYTNEPDRTCFQVSGRRSAIYACSTEKFRGERVMPVSAVFSPVEGDNNPFEIHDGDPRTTQNDFSSRTTPTFTKLMNVPFFRNSEAIHLSIIAKHFKTTSGVRKTDYSDSLEMENKKALHQVFGSLYTWGLVREINEVLYFNTEAIQQIAAILDPIDWVGVSYRDNADILNHLEKMVYGRTVLRRMCGDKARATHLDNNTAHFDKKELIDNCMLPVATITDKGRKVYEAWKQVQKICEPYARQAQQRIKE